MKKIILIISFLICINVNAETNKTELYDREIFDNAKQQILQMKMDELDELRIYLSSCGTSAGGETKRFFCERSARAYILKYGQGKSVEQLILAMAELEFLIDLVDEADEKGQASDKLKMQVFRDLDRYVLIREMMETAIKQAYAKLLN